MIPIERVYTRINADLVRKGKAGYASSDEFNRDIRDAQNLLHEYYTKLYDSGQAVKDSMSPFVKQADLAIASDAVTFPADYRHLLLVSYLDVKNVPGGQPTVTVRPMIWLSVNEVGLTLSSEIRKPLYPKRLYFEQTGTGVKVYPTLTGSTRIHYLSAPPEAKRGYTVNVTTLEEDYDVVTTIDLAWNEQDETNLIDILLFFKGLAIRETELLQWVGAKKNLK